MRNDKALPTMLQNEIAAQRFRCVTPSGTTLDVTVRLGLPARVKTEGGKHEYAECQLILEPMAGNRRVGGSNEFQAICLALDYLRKVFAIYSAEGGRIYWEDTNSPVDITSSWFAPLLSLEQIRAEQK